MNVHVTLASTILMMAGGLGWSGAIAAEPATSTVQQPDVCRQVGEDYREVYTIDEENQSITICQKEGAYYYIAQAKNDNEPFDVSARSNDSQLEGKEVRE